MSMPPDVNPNFVEVTKENFPRIVEETRREAAEVIAAGIREFIAESAEEFQLRPAPGLEAALFAKAMKLYDEGQAPHIAQIERRLDGTTVQ